MALPLLGRLSALQWPMVIASFVAVYFEMLVSIITYAIPTPVIKLFTKILDVINTYFIGGNNYEMDTPHSEEQALLDKIRSAENINQMGALFGYEIDDHVVQTKDGYLLCLHRIKPKREGAPAVYLHHGLLMCSDIWCVNLKKEQNLPFRLHELGFDVWMGNNRGNKYSAKHIWLKPKEQKFWDFSIDEFALHDIPNSISYILEYTGLQNLTYIGFSQGSAQAFAALSINPLLNKQVNLFIALSPALTPRGLHNRLVDALMKASPDIMNLIFGKKILLPSATFWKNIIYPPLFVRVIDIAVAGLFDWKGLNITFNQKIASYSHLYSPTSVKSVVHWFQIIRNFRFQMFDDEISLTTSFTKPFRALSFPTKSNIKVPIRLLYGTVDSLVDINQMLSLLPSRDTKAIGIQEHEHLDVIWGDKVEDLVFPYIFEFLDQVNKAEVNGKETRYKSDEN